MDNMVDPQHPGAGQKGPGGADIQRLGQVEELRSACIHTTDEHRNLQANTGRTATLSGVQAHPFSLRLCLLQARPSSTLGLVPLFKVQLVFQKGPPVASSVSSL